MKATVRDRSGALFSEEWRRSMGFTPPGCFPRRVSASEGLVKRLDLYAQLVGHEGCVNAVEFNSTGTALVSGSDDKQIIFWDWETKKMRLSYPSGHYDNVFQTKIMPFTNDQIVVTSGGDGQVRVGQVLPDGSVTTKRLGRHRGQVYKLAVEPGSSYVLYSCGGDGIVKHFDLRTDSSTKLFSCSTFAASNKVKGPLPSPRIRLNSIVIDPRNPNYLAVGGSDEYARVYDLRRHQWLPTGNTNVPVDTFCPPHLKGNGNVHITGLAYSSKRELLVSYNDELVYLFDGNMGMGPNPLIKASNLDEAGRTGSEEKPQVYSGHRNSQTIKGVSFFGLNDEFVVSGSDCGHIFVWRKRGAELVRVVAGDFHVVNQLEAHPSMPVLASCGLENNAKIWMPTSTDVQPLPPNIEEVMESNRKGREEPSRVRLTPGMFMHVLRLQGRGVMPTAEWLDGGGVAPTTEWLEVRGGGEGEGQQQQQQQRQQQQEGEGEENGGGEAYVLGFPNGGGGASPAESEDPRECYIS